jgi:hypothetical protein
MTRRNVTETGLEEKVTERIPPLGGKASNYTYEILDLGSHLLLFWGVFDFDDGN